MVRVDYALSWFRLRQIPLVAQRVQVDTYLACGLVSETLNQMTDAFLRDYLIERIQMALDHRALTGYYPRLSLAPGQRFASKGGYVVRFTEPEGPRIAALGLCCTSAYLPTPLWAERARQVRSAGMGAIAQRVKVQRGHLAGWSRRQKSALLGISKRESVSRPRGRYGR